MLDKEYTFTEIERNGRVRKVKGRQMVYIW